MEQLLKQVEKPLKSLVKGHRPNMGKATQSLDSKYQFSTEAFFFATMSIYCNFNKRAY